jgi:CRISPR-associated endonuclease Cas1
MSRRLDQVRSAHSIAQLMGLEGSCARAYWRGIATTVDTGVFETRIGRGAKDTSNAMLNYGYAVLRSRILGMVERVGLEPTIGFLHSDREGRVSLVLDLMEPWRVIVEDAAFSLLRRHAGRFESQRQATRMTADAVVARLEAEPDGEASTVELGIYESIRQLREHILAGQLQDFHPYEWNVRGPKRPEECVSLPEGLFL